MVSKQAIIKWGTILFIGFFFLEFFVPLLYVPKEEPTPTPTVVESANFQGSGSVLATVVQNTKKALVTCPGFDVISKNSTIVSSVLSLGSDNFLVELSESSTPNGLNGFLALNCPQYSFTQQAFVQLNQSLVLRDASSGQNRIITPSQGASYARVLGLPGLPGFISPNATIGDLVNMTAFVRMQGETVADFRLTQGG